MDKTQKQKPQKTTHQANTLESIKDIPKSAAKSIKEDLLEKAPRDFLEQLLSTRQTQKFSGEISVGETVELKEVFTGEHDKRKKLEMQVFHERRLRMEDEIQVNEKTQELRLQIKVLQEEVLTLAQNTQDLAETTKIAAMQAPVEPGVYHIVFFQKLIEFIKSFRKKIEEASVWLHSSNNRAAKKNSWVARYQKHGAKYLLSGEHYVSRSAG